MPEEPPDEQKLTEAFRSLGVHSPERCARSQVEEHVPHLAICVFLKLLVEQVATLSDFESILEVVRHSSDKFAHQALHRLMSAGATPDEVSSVVRAVATEFVVNVCFLLDNTAASRFDGWQFRELLDSIQWSLYQTGPDGKPTGVMEGLHEVVSEFLKPNRP